MIITYSVSYNFVFVSLLLSLPKILNRFSYSVWSVNRQNCELIEVALMIVTDRMSLLC